MVAVWAVVAVVVAGGIVVVVAVVVGGSVVVAVVVWSVVAFVVVVEVEIVLIGKRERSLDMEKKEEAVGLVVGQAYIVRTVTYHYTGRLVAMADGWLVMEDAAWVADSGRWSDALSQGTLNEIEPYPGLVYVNRAAVVDISPWNHPLPCQQK